MRRRTASNPEGGKHGAEQAALRSLIEAIAARDSVRARQLVEASPEVTRWAIAAGATRADAASHYFEGINHYAYAGDTALHLAAAAYQRDVVEELLRRGAGVDAQNRRGARPLHYASDGVPGSSAWEPSAQAATVAQLLQAGADADAVDKSGVAPLHRAARTRSVGAVRALLEGGADVRLRNGSGSEALHLAVQDTGRGGSGAEAARVAQREVIALLLRYGAKASDLTASGKAALELVKADWIRELLLEESGVRC